MPRKARVEFRGMVYHLIDRDLSVDWLFSPCTGSEWSELGSREMDCDSGAISLAVVTRRR